MRLMLKRVRKRISSIKSNIYRHVCIFGVWALLDDTHCEIQRLLDTIINRFPLGATFSGT